MTPPAATAWIGLGSNMDAEAHLTAAVRLLEAHPRLRLTRLSPVYRTPPWGPVPQDDYLNAVAELTTALAPEALLEALLGIETQCGRERSVRWGPRTLDLDLLLYGDRVQVTPQLTLPHTHLHERAFVLVPLCDLAPELVHPVLERTMGELLTALPAAELAAVAAAGITLRTDAPR